jgi:hypothetical protein
MSDDSQYTPLGRTLEFLLSAVFVAVLVSILYGAKAFGADKPIQPPDCWPWWQCNGSKETNHPNCKCWDSK